MTTRPYQITAEPARRLVSVRFAPEFLEPDVAERFGEEVLAAVASLHCAPGSHLVLVDLREAVIQSQEVFGRMQALVGTSVAARIALVAAAPLARMQTKRLQVRENVVLFAELDEARAWLLSADERAAA